MASWFRNLFGIMTPKEKFQLNYVMTNKPQDYCTEYKYNPNQQIFSDFTPTMKRKFGRFCSTLPPQGGGKRRTRCRGGRRKKMQTKRMRR